jgi:hypothetical protein
LTRLKSTLREREQFVQRAGAAAAAQLIEVEHGGARQHLAAHVAAQEEPA